MQLGIPITIIKGGISAVKMVISKPNKPIIPNDQLTPISTTTMDMKVAL